jgi:hypothetical protein
MQTWQTIKTRQGFLLTQLRKSFKHRLTLTTRQIMAKPETIKSDKTAQPLKKKDVTGWKDAFIVDAYEMARDGASRKEIAVALGVNFKTFKNRWLINRPLLRYAIDRGKAYRLKMMEQTLSQKTEEALSPKVRGLWEQIKEASEIGSAFDVIHSLLHDETDAVRQKLWLQAVINFDFDVKTACQVTGITKRTIDRWTREDPDFLELVDEVMWHKKNFIEAKLLALVKNGDSRAAIFASQTLNADRGYGKESKIKIEGSITHNHVMSIGRLNLDTDTLLKIEDAMKRADTEEKDRLRLPPLAHAKAHNRLDKVLEAELV